LQAAAQLLTLFVILYFWLKSSRQTRYEYIRRIKPLIFPTGIVVFSFFLSYFFAGKLENKDWSFLLNLLGVVGYAYLACFYCNSLENIKKILWVLIGIGMMQLPVMYAMSRGWTNGLLGNLGILSNQSWGGFASDYVTTALRYPGLFGDYELLAEYLDMMILFSIGISLFTHSIRERIFSILAAFLMIVAGFYTGTRAFVVGLAVGLGIMIILFAIRSGYWKKFTHILIIGVLIISVLYFLSTQEIFRGYFDRFLNTDLSSGYYDTRNEVWTTSFSMMQKLPFTGYGNQMMEIFDTIGRGIYASPHSLYFSMFLTSGFPGIIAIIIMICIPFLWMIGILINRRMKYYHAWSIVMISVWAFWVANEIKIELIRYAFYMNTVFFLFGIFASFYDLAFKNPVDIKSLKG
jgi:O-antigen ligase